MKFISIGRNDKFIKEYANEFIQKNCGGKAKLISKKIVKNFSKAFFQTRRVEILYYDFPHVIDCRAGGFQLDIFQLYGEVAPHKPYKTSNPFAVVSLWNVGAVAYAELKENGYIEFTPFTDTVVDDDPFEIERKKQATEENWKAKVMILKNHYTKDAEFDVENITRDLIFYMFPKKKDTWWEEAARKFILGYVLAQSEDFVEGKLEEDQLNLVNIFKRLNDSLSDMQELENYLSKERLYNFQIKALTEGILKTYGKTLAAYLSEINKFLSEHKKEQL